MYLRSTGLRLSHVHDPVAESASKRFGFALWHKEFDKFAYLCWHEAARFMNVQYSASQ